MYSIFDLFRLDWVRLSWLADCGVFWEFVGFASYELPCVNLECVETVPVSSLYANGDTAVFACSSGCAAAGVRQARARFERLEFQNNVAVSVVPVGDIGSYKLIRPFHGSLF